MHYVSSTVACLGDFKPEIPTPVLCLDLDSFQHNVSRIASTITAAGKHWRPHAGCHKSPQIALQQIRQGAIGITCAKISEAEAFASSGIQDILIAHLPVGNHRCQHLAHLCKHAAPLVTCDHYVQAQELAAECTKQGVECRVLVELNVGMERTGVRPGRDAIELGKGVDRLPGLKLAGIMGFAGHIRSLTDPDDKARAIDASMGILSHMRELYLSNDLCCDIVSAVGSDSWEQSLRYECLTEIQAGSAIFGNPWNEPPAHMDGLRTTLTVLATVVSRPGFDRAVLDAGRNAIPADGRPIVVHEWPDASIDMQTAEHTVFQLGPASRELRIGDRVELMVNNADMTTALHDEILCFRQQRLEAIWPISARGKLI